jgi:HlyD family secretion protein
MRPLTAATLALTLCVLTLAGCGNEEIDAISPRVGEIRESFTEPAQTRLARTYRVTAPIAGRISRIELEPGDTVTKDQPLATYDLAPFEHALAEARAAVAELESRIVLKDDNRLEDIALEEATGAVSAVEDTLKASQAQIEAEQARADYAVRERARKEALAESKTIPESELDDARLAADTALIALRERQFSYAAFKTLHVISKLGPRAVREYVERKQLDRQTLLHQLAQAQARLASAEHDRAMASIASPIDGVVLERFEQGDGALSAGMPLLLLGNLDELEVIADVLTQDALRLRPGSRVELDPGIAAASIDGEVKRIEPAAFTKLSSLGVEQQRVNAIVSIEGDRGRLDVGYRVQARFLTGTKSDALIVPRFSVLQDVDQTFYVLKIVDGALAKQPIELGLRGDLDLEVVEGLFPKDIIAATPDTTMEEGQKVSPRPTIGPKSQATPR